MGEYRNNGKQVLFVQDGKSEHIADAGSNEKAHSLAMAMNQRSSNYIRDAQVTLSPSFFGERVSKVHFTGRMNAAIDALNKLDQVKKSLFYGRDNNLEPAKGAKDVQGLNERVGSGGVNGANIVHAVIGIATEAGELLEALRDDYNRDETGTMDSVNLREEAGDLFWYMAILAHECGFDFEDAMRINIAKLRKRYADKFDRVDANERDLAAERAILEDGAAPLVATTDVGVAKGFEGSGPLASMDDNGGDYAPIETGADPLLIKPSVPASGKLPVAKVAREANIAFGRLQNITPSEPEATTSDLGGELAKSPAARQHPLPQERMAQNNAGEFDRDKK